MGIFIRKGIRPEIIQKSQFKENIFWKQVSDYVQMVALKLFSNEDFFWYFFPINDKHEIDSCTKFPIFRPCPRFEFLKL